MAFSQATQSRQLKILCLHGHRQNANMFREKTGAFRKIIKKKANLVYITAPNKVPPLDNVDDSNFSKSDLRSWWFSRDEHFDAHDISNGIKGFDESLKFIEAFIQEDGPFDGVLGFSQGASMVSLLCLIQEKEPEKWFRFAILMAGFKSRSPSHTQLYTSKISIPSLHVYGDGDNVIAKGMSEDLLHLYTNPVIHQHKGGHFVPASSQEKEIYLQFLDNFAHKGVVS